MSKLRGFFATLKVGVRVAIGFVSILVLLGVVAGVSYSGFLESERNTKKFSGIAGAYEHVARVETTFAEMQRAVFVYAQTGAAEAEKQVRALQQVVSENAALAEKEIVAQDRREMIRGVTATFQRYVAGFDQVVKAKAAQATIDQTMRPMGGRMQQLLSDLMQSSAMTDEMSTSAYAGMAQELLLAARLNINIYFINSAPPLAKAALDNINKLPGAIKQLRDAITSESDKARTMELASLAEKYVPGVANTISVTNERNRAIEEMTVKLAAQMAQQLGTLSKAQMKALDDIREETLTTISWAATVSIAIAGLALVIGLALAFIIGRGISKPLGRMSGVLAELAKGNKAIEIPFTDRGDEIGDNARAAQAFKENLLRVEAMEAEQKANEARTEAERQAVLEKMAQEFEMAVGGIVKAAVAGDFSRRVDIEGKSGMVLNVGTAINSLCENVARALDDLITMLNALAEGDMTRRITAQYEGNFAELKNNANATAERIGATIAEIKASAREVTGASAEISSSTTDLSQRTE